MSRATRVVLAVMAGCLLLGAGVAIGANVPSAEDFQGNFTVEDPNWPPTPVTCGNWQELRNRTYIGTISSSTHPELHNKKMVVAPFYLGGHGTGSGVALATVSVYTQGIGDLLVARGPLTVATDGRVPPDNIANGNGYMELTFYNRGQPTPRRAIAIVRVAIASNIQGTIGGSVTGKSVVWNGEKCP
jgi:hypothetical protein